VQLCMQNGGLELHHPFDSSKLKVVIADHPAQLSSIRNAFVGTAIIPDPTTANVHLDALRNWRELAENSVWQSCLAKMIDAAKDHGYLDERTGTVKAYVEWVGDGSNGDEARMKVERCNKPRSVTEDLPVAFRNAMRRLAATVSIVTTRHEGLSYGMTATAVSSLTVEPPALLVCINQAASIHEHIRNAGYFCVNLLGVGHEDLGAAFSGKLKGQERFSVGEWQTEGPLMPYLKTAQANIFCRLDGDVEYATHTIFIGRVEKVHVQDDVESLVYQNGSFGRFNAHASF
jgi:flavin reductase